MATILRSRNNVDNSWIVVAWRILIRILIGLLIGVRLSRVWLLRWVRVTLLGLCKARRRWRALKFDILVSKMLFFFLARGLEVDKILFHNRQYP